MRVERGDTTLARRKLLKILEEEEQQNKEQHPMWEYLHDGHNYRPLRRGDIREGLIVKVDANEVIVDIGAKRDAVIPASDLARLSEEERKALKPGDRIPVFILNPSGRDEEPVGSLNLALEQQDWERAEELLKTGEIVEAEVIGYNKGGLIVRFGRLRGFVPASHVASRDQREGNRQKQLAQHVGMTLPLKVIEVNRERRRLVFSHREALAEWQEQQRAKLIEELEVGEVRHGVVTGLTDFGAFVDLGGAEGLIHISQLSWHSVQHPSEVLKVGQEVDVYVMDLDPERNRIALSLKLLQPDPWTTAAGRYEVGQVVEGDVVNVVKFGAFVRIEPGIEGLIHISELGALQTDDARQVLHVGDRVRVEIISLQPEEHKMGLRLLEVLHPEEPEAMEAPQAEESPQAEE